MFIQLIGVTYQSRFANRRQSNYSQEYRDEFSHTSMKTTRQIEELVRFTFLPVIVIAVH
jgi:hypothetical protein